MWTINLIVGKIVEILILPFKSLHPLISMAWLSLITGIFMLIIYKFTSNQVGIRRVKDKIKAHLMEIRYYKDDLKIILRAQGKILRYNLTYVKYSLVPFAVMVIPIIMLLAQMNLWYGYTPLKEGDSVLIAAKLSDKMGDPMPDISLDLPQGLELESPPMKISFEREIDWRIKVKKNGSYTLRFKSSQEEIEKEFIASEEDRLIRISPKRFDPNILEEFLYPGEKPLPKDSAIESIEIKYELGSIPLFGWNIHWIIYYFVFSVAFGFALKGLFKVDI